LNFLLSSSETPKRLPSTFEELSELSDLSSACKECGLQEEFLEYVMQHKISTNS
jgi:hypothetical protein